MAFYSAPEAATGISSLRKNAAFQESRVGIRAAIAHPLY